MTFTSPPENLAKMARFIIFIYANIWFQLKCNPKCQDAPRIMFQAMKLYLALPQEDKNVVLPIFENGAYYFHSENLLLSMLNDPDKDVRKLAVEKILQIRRNPTIQKKPRRGKGSDKMVRIFNKPKPVYGADKYYEAINWDIEDKFEPPLVREFSESQLLAIIDNPITFDIPHHTQHVKRLIRVITQKGKSAASDEKREGMTIATLKDRQQRPRCETKGDFVI
jgi:hypothetical protein